ncbi:hypothetical protein TNCV_1488611 [Trichonephila clavipes]|nr:hypothetical protein TNCV_1488611 [Trichonephila clavipes]
MVSGIMSKPNSLLNRQQDVLGSSRDRVRRVWFQLHWIIEHLVKRLNASPKQIQIGSTPQTGRRKFIDQHGDVCRLNNVNLCGFFRLKPKVKSFFTKNILL